MRRISRRYLRYTIREWNSNQSNCQLVIETDEDLIRLILIDDNANENTVIGESRQPTVIWSLFNAWKSGYEHGFMYGHSSFDRDADLTNDHEQPAKTNNTKSTERKWSTESIIEQFPEFFNQEEPY